MVVAGSRRKGGGRATIEGVFRACAPIGGLNEALGLLMAVSAVNHPRPSIARRLVDCATGSEIDAARTRRFIRQMPPDLLGSMSNVWRITDSETRPQSRPRTVHVPINLARTLRNGRSMPDCVSASRQTQTDQQREREADMSVPVEVSRILLRDTRQC